MTLLPGVAGIDLAPAPQSSFVSTHDDEHLAWTLFTDRPTIEQAMAREIQRRIGGWRDDSRR